MRSFRIFTICIVLLSVVADSYAANCRIPQIVAGGEYHSMVLMTDGSVWACGNGGDGILGNGYTDNQYELVQVHAGEQLSASLPDDITSASTGTNHFYSS